MLFARKIEATAATAILSIVFVPRAAYSQNLSKDDDRIQSELSAIGKRGDTIKRVREQTSRSCKLRMGAVPGFKRPTPMLRQCLARCTTKSRRISLLMFSVCPTGQVGIFLSSPGGPARPRMAVETPP